MKFFKDKVQDGIPTLEAGKSEKNEIAKPPLPPPESEIITTLRPLLSFSQTVGVPGFSHLQSHLSKHKLYALYTWNLLLVLNEVLLISGRIQQVQDSRDLAEPHVIVFLVHAHVILVHLWSILYSKRLAWAIQRFRDMESIIEPFTEEQRTDRARFARARGLSVASLYTVFAVWYTLKPVFTQVYYHQRSTYEALAGYAEIPNACPVLWAPAPDGLTSAYCVLSTLCANFVWAFGDFLLLVLAIMFAELFRRLNRRIWTVDPQKVTAVEVEVLREHHGLIANCVADFDDAICVLTFINIGFNVLLFLCQDYGRMWQVLVKQNSNRSYLAELEHDAVAVVVKLAISCTAAAVLNRRAHAAFTTIRTWPFSRDLSHDFNEKNSKASVIYMFLGQLKSPKIGFTCMKISTITPKFVSCLVVVLLGCLAFNRIILALPGNNISFGRDLNVGSGSAPFKGSITEGLQFGFLQNTTRGLLN